MGNTELDLRQIQHALETLGGALRAFVESGDMATFGITLRALADELGLHTEPRCRPRPQADA